MEETGGGQPAAASPSKERNRGVGGFLGCDAFSSFNFSGFLGFARFRMHIWSITMTFEPEAGPSCGSRHQRNKLGTLRDEMLRTLQHLFLEQQPGSHEHRRSRVLPRTHQLCESVYPHPFSIGSCARRRQSCPN